MPSAGATLKTFATAQSQDVVTSETTTSTSYTDLTTSGPSVQVALRAGQTCLVIANVHFFIDTSPAGARASVSFAVSGAETIAATDTDRCFTSVAADYVVGHRTSVFQATTGGDYTFTLKYKIEGAVTGTFAQRRIVAVPQP